MFSQVFVCPHGEKGLPTGGSASMGESASKGICIQAGLHQGGPPRGFCIQGSCAATPPRTRKVGSTYPTGMLSLCYKSDYRLAIIYQILC